MGKPSIKMYYDVVSPYAWMGVDMLIRYQKAWGHSIDVEYIPFFLGGIMVGAGNKPPATVPAKGVYMKKDLARSFKLRGFPPVKQPSIFPVQSYKQMRIICALKEAADKGEVDEELPLKVAYRLWTALWIEDKNTSEESIMQSELDPLLPGGWEKWKYTISDPAMKKRLTELTTEALETGCFGGPWMVITNSKGKTDVFFGSDRWDHVCDFLSVEYLGYFPRPKSTGTEGEAKL